jgi:hypothetical protein
MFCISSKKICWKQICVLCRPYGFGMFGQQTTGVKKDNKMVVIILGV